MEKWKEVFKGTIPQSNYQIRLINGEENGLIIKLYDVNNLVIIKFGNVRAVRMLDEGIVQTQIYAINELEKYKKNNFKNIIYEIQNGEFENYIHKIADSYWDIIQPRHYVIVTMNYNIDIIAENEPIIEMKKINDESNK